MASGNLNAHAQTTIRAATGAKIRNVPPSASAGTGEAQASPWNARVAASTAGKPEPTNLSPTATLCQRELSSAEALARLEGRYPSVPNIRLLPHIRMTHDALTPAGIRRRNQARAMIAPDRQDPVGQPHNITQNTNFVFSLYHGAKIMSRATTLHCIFRARSKATNREPLLDSLRSLEK